MWLRIRLIEVKENLRCMKTPVYSLLYGSNVNCAIDASLHNLACPVTTRVKLREGTGIPKIYSRES